MQYKCSSTLVNVTELENQEESLKSELKKDGAGRKSYSTEEALWKTRWSNDNVAGKLHDEFKRLYEQLYSMFASNEKVATGRS
ncbi:hypothetical protein DY000_02049590 [Brassica cretica]|uniref:Uncharacterized protein n=1 Tax=Brassica cretica TaxID=69181 RepID=A0ABQ7ESP6_BRACR|nr:hypothetical protein DY000_02049590 [Brassica cretica]